MQFTTAAAEQRYAEVVRAADDLAVGLDFDGTLSPIVDDPREAHIDPAAPAVLIALAHQCRALAVITGRPARQVLALGGLDEVGDAIGEAGRELFIFGQYGNERWSSQSRRVITPPPPPGLASFLRDLPRLIRRTGLEPWVEEKGLAIAVHTRKLDDPAAAYDALLPLLTESARGHDLHVEPGRFVIEVRAAGMDKGVALDRLVDEVGAKAVVFAGDDLGDLEAFEAGEALRRRGFPVLLVCSASAEQSRLAELADVITDGPPGVLEFLRRLCDDIVAARA
jgi:trehalose 6-phosphate phosphatase